MNFEEAEKYLFSLGNEVEAMKLGLENIRTLLAALGDPHRNYKKVQVAGTNGKGSVCAFLDSICREAGIRTGLYTSPHLVSITERVKIDGVDIAEAEFARLVSRVRETAETLFAEGKIAYSPTYFEQVTAVALVAFAEAEVDLAILETGMGGRLDATTAAEAEIVAITQIALDHQEYLGETIEEIASEKAAVIRPGVTAVLAHQEKKVERVLEGRCRETGVDPVWATTNIRITRDPKVAPIFTAYFTTEKDNYPSIEFFHMVGEHQVKNASVAIAVAEQLRDYEFEISNFQICIGLERAQHPGRLEGRGDFLFDGAHNSAGAQALADYLARYVEREITMIFGAMQGKDVAAMAKILFPMAEKVVLTSPENSRAMAPAGIAEIIGKNLAGRTVVVSNVKEAVTKARQLSSPGGLILVTGSLYLVGEVKKLLNN